MHKIDRSIPRSISSFLIIKVHSLEVAPRNCSLDFFLSHRFFGAYVNSTEPSKVVLLYPCLYVKNTIFLSIFCNLPPKNVYISPFPIILLGLKSLLDVKGHTTCTLVNNLSKFHTNTVNETFQLLN